MKFRKSKNCVFAVVMFLLIEQVVGENATGDGCVCTPCVYHPPIEIRVAEIANYVVVMLDLLSAMATIYMVRLFRGIRGPDTTRSPAEAQPLIAGPSQPNEFPMSLYPRLDMGMGPVYRAGTPYPTAPLPSSGGEPTIAEDVVRRGKAVFKINDHGESRWSIVGDGTDQK